MALQCLIVYFHSFGCAGAKTFDDHIGCGGEFQERVAPARVAIVDRDAFLSLIDHFEETAQSHFGRGEARVIAGGGSFHFNYLGAHVGK